MNTAELIIVGDINIHLDDATYHHTTDMMQTLHSYGLKQHIHEATHYCGHTLDVLINRDCSTLLSAIDVKGIGLCDDKGNLVNGHYAITCTLHHHAAEIKSKSVSYRQLKGINTVQFKQDIQASAILNNTTGTAEHVIETYKEGLSSLLDIHAPLVCRTITPRPHAAWYTETLRESKRLRRSLERKWRQTRSITDKLQYRQQCATVAKQLNDRKTEYYSMKIAECGGDSKQIHRLTDKLLISQSQQRLPSTDDDVLLANRFSNYFETKIDNIRNGFQINVTANDQPRLNQYTTIHQFRLASSEEIIELITSYSNKSCELDTIPTWLLKDCINELLPLIMSIINNSISTGIFPSQFKQAIVRPLLKKSDLDPELLKNYRPVSNLNFISKIVEKVIMQRLDEHLTQHSLHDPLQSAYRKDHSTETAITKIHHDIITSLDEGRCTVLASLDLSAAFDTVDHDILLHRLWTYYGIRGIAHQWFSSYLHDRQTKICINSSYSESRRLKCGVPQGSVLGARLYTMYTRQMSAIMDNHSVRYHSYADDTQVYLECDNNEVAVRNAVDRLEKCISDVCEWMNGNSLKINEDKTDFIIFSAHADQYKHIRLTVGTDNVQASESIKILGVTLDHSMNMKKAIANTCRSAHMYIRKINSIPRYLCEDSTKLLVNSTVLSRLDYCNSIYVGLPQTSLYKLQLAQNCAARIITNTPRHDHITPVLQQLHWLTIQKRCQLKILVLTFKVLHNNSPQYICELLQWYTPSRALRSASTTSLVPNRSRTIRYGKRLIGTSAATLWNALPNHIKSARNVIQFKRLLKEVLQQPIQFHQI